jgi:fatty acid desaturase
MEGWKRFFWVFKLFMVFVYMVVGVLILFFDVLPLSIGNAGRIFFGIVIILYGIFRFYALYQFLKTERDEA